METVRLLPMYSQLQDLAAYGFLKVANESMCRPIRAITVSKGIDASNNILASFGGAGIFGF